MTRRDFLPTLALLAVPELTAPSTPDERLTQAVDVWVSASATLADLAAAYEASTRALQSARGLVPPHRLRAMVEARRAAREEREAGERALAEAERRMDEASRLVGGGG